MSKETQMTARGPGMTTRREVAEENNYGSYIFSAGLVLLTAGIILVKKV